MTRARTIADYAKQTTDLATQTELDAAETALGFQSVPHIVPGVLYPAVAGKLLDGSTSHSGAYGTAQADGYSYYYTDIKGSKPIKDPRIGAHFGSQRYTFRSMQKLEQETATHGEEIFSLDGRENIRVGNFPSGSNYMVNNHWGNFFSSNRAGTFLEITGYFNDINIIIRSYTASSKTLAITVNGVTAHSALDLKSTADSPLNVSRYVSVGMLRNIDITSSSSLSSDTALGINTIKFTMPATDIDFHGIELIAQDTSSTANKSKIQIPSQNVVSYGKKFTVSGTPHYDPFNGFTSGTDISGYIDEATSLGMSNWKVSSTWYRPFNGGRVVKWVDSSGTIKTSVNMMPPNAQNAGTTASNAIDLSSSQTTDDTINFNTSAIDHSLSEVAKTFHWREFGNGNANGGTGATNYADASMLSTTEDDIAYVMDDGLTSLAGNVKEGGGNLYRVDADSFSYLTFIGTGITKTTGEQKSGFTVAQNLPYGTHIFYQDMDSSTTAADWYIDGIKVADITGGSPDYEGEQFFYDMSIHQPKKPPIPEDAVVLADYMLMADWVNSNSGAIGTIPKGAREVSPSRDLFYDSDGSLEHFYSGNYSSGWFFGDGGTESTINTNFAELPVFGTRFHVIGYDMDTRSDLYVDGSIATSTGTTGSNHSTYLRLTNPETNLGIHKFRVANKANGRITFGNFFVDSPIHTSSHYSTFSTPFLHELVGGDRNMEQTNLVVTSDGKTWDEVTRDTSYIGKGVLAARISADYTSETTIIFDDFRGLVELQPLYNKDFAIAYDRFICLKDGAYNVDFMFHASAAATSCYLRFFINGTRATESQIEGAGSLRGNLSQSINYNFKRGDYLQISATNRIEGTDQRFHTFQITRL